MVKLSNTRTMNYAVTYPGHFRDLYTGLGTQTLAPKKHLQSFLFSVVLQQKCLE